MKFLVLGMILGLIVNFGSASVTPPGKEFYHSLPDEERLDFLTFSLGDGYTKNSTKLHRTIPDFRFPDELGIDASLLEKFKNLKAPENFTSNLYIWIRARYNLDQRKMRTLILERAVYSSSGKYIDIGDIGGLCCPF